LRENINSPDSQPTDVTVIVVLSTIGLVALVAIIVGFVVIRNRDSEAPRGTFLEAVSVRSKISRQSLGGTQFRGKPILTLNLDIHLSVQTNFLTVMLCSPIMLEFTSDKEDISICQSVSESNDLDFPFSPPTMNTNLNVSIDAIKE
jgi:hypothetical protein